MPPKDPHTPEPPTKIQKTNTPEPSTSTVEDQPSPPNLTHTYSGLPIPKPIPISRPLSMTVSYSISEFNPPPEANFYFSIFVRYKPTNPLFNLDYCFAETTRIVPNDLTYQLPVRTPITVYKGEAYFEQDVTHAFSFDRDSITSNYPNPKFHLTFVSRCAQEHIHSQDFKLSGSEVLRLTNATPPEKTVLCPGQLWFSLAPLTPLPLNYS